MKMSRVSAACFAVMCVASPAWGAPNIVIEPDTPVILGDKVHIIIDGLEPGSEFSLIGESAGPKNKVIRSKVVFKADPNGRSDLERHAPESGSYRGIDPLGIFWSRNDTAEPTPDHLKSAQGQSKILFKVEVDGKVVAQKEHIRYLVKPGVKKTEIRTPNMQANYYVPEGEGPFAAVVIIGGSEGGIAWADRMAGLLASKGFASLGLAYFGMRDLPPNLERIPLEYFTHAISWLRNRPEIAPDRVGLLGTSKGAEAALLVGSKISEVRTVVAYVPSSVAWQSLAPAFPHTPSWTQRGQDLKFLQYMPDDKFARSGRLVDLYQATFDYFLEKDRTKINDAAIVAEKIEGPVLLISAESDGIWPSATMAAGTFLRLSATKHPYEDDHLMYPGAGHDIAQPGYTRVVHNPATGGTRDANAHARADSWTKVIDFLDRALKQR
jgi:dienelactone hydrolase